MPGLVDALMLHPSMTYGSCGVPEPETTASDVPSAASPSMRTGAWAARVTTWGGIGGLPALACAGTNSNDNRIQAAKARGNTPRPPASHSSSRAREGCGGSSFDDSDTKSGPAFSREDLHDEDPIPRRAGHVRDAVRLEKTRNRRGR